MGGYEEGGAGAEDAGVEVLGIRDRRTEEVRMGRSGGTNVVK